MARLEDPDPESFTDEVRDLVAALPPDEMNKMLSHGVGTMNLFVKMARTQFSDLELPGRLREMVILTVAVYTDCSFEIAKHEPVARDSGVEGRVRQLIRARWIDSPELSDHDRTLLRFTVEVLRSPTVSDELFDSVRGILSEREIIEVLQVIGYYWTSGRIVTVLDVQLTEVYR
ncbi:carboxymuconolactone decarboxylase family protein [Actinoplanes sp. NPDC051513]|uniref:carboxymuconolactone decarboxylase family protein n=1 Tax=Actinoplanes sp. NPDC051513 TaxID=3363908 RepID=UPI0037920302